jgi:predicted nucleic acid-binding protein
MSRIFWDTNLFIYLFETNGAFTERVAEIREAMNRRGDQLFTSTLTVGEVLAGPARAERNDVAKKYEQALVESCVLVPFDVAAAREFTQIRRDRSVKPPDAIQLACAAVAKIDLFITNDERLSKTIVPGIQFIAPLAKAFL